tara:strand:+ start:359 stop:796 length:438 start_codon:yes stop_codon:yes gene_type:complete
MSVAIIRRIPSRNQSDQVWIAWFDALKKEFGRKKAIQLFIANWDKESGDNSGANTVNLRNHMEKSGIDIDGGVIGGLKDFGSGAYGYVGDIFNASKLLGIGLASVVVISMGVLIFQIAVRPSVRQEAIRVGSAVATRGATEIGKK